VSTDASLVSTDWLAAHLDAPDLRILDGTYFLPNEGRDARKEYEAEHIPGALFFDIDDIKDRASPLPHMLPEPEVFASRMRRMGIGDGHRIVVYDGKGIFSSPRVWWTFRVFGHRDVAVLDGGLPKWKAEGRPLDDRLPRPEERHFTARLDKTLVRDRQQLLTNLEARREQVVDARSAGRFTGEQPEPRAGLRGGHIPGSLNLPFDQLIDPQTRTFLRPDRLAAAFRQQGVDLNRPIVTTCGSGVTASVLAFALDRIGHPGAAVYDGSWSEWGLPGDTPVVTGPAEGEPR